MRLAGTPSLPVVVPVSRPHLARNFRGVSDIVILDKLLDALLHHLPLPFPTLLFPLLRFPPLLFIFVAPLQHPFLHLIVFPCPLLSCSPLLIYDELYRPSFVPVLMKDILLLMEAKTLGISPFIGSAKTGPLATHALDLNRRLISFIRCSFAVDATKPLTHWPTRSNRRFAEKSALRVVAFT
jgi:hypothetical protein